MTEAGKSMRRAAGALAILAAATGGSITPVEAGSSSFPSAVEQILLNQTEGHVSTLSSDKKRELVVCVNNVLSAMPNGMKRFVLEGSTYDDMESRFGKVVMDNRAEWKQKIARGCAHIVV